MHQHRPMPHIHLPRTHIHAVVRPSKKLAAQRKIINACHAYGWDGAIVQALGHDEWRGYNTTAVTTIKHLSPKQVGIGKS